MSPDIVIVGGGPVGLWVSTQLKKRRPELQIEIRERHEEYKRSHVLRLEYSSLLLYGKNSNDPLEQKFYQQITGKSLTDLFLSAAGHINIRTNDLEQSLKEYSKEQGNTITYTKVEDPQSLMEEYPDCKTFIAADGARSTMREKLLGEGAVRIYTLQHIAEMKYQANGRAGKLGAIGTYKTNKLLNHMAFEVVGREKEGLTPVTLRFFLDKAAYDSMPEAGFGAPLLLGDAGIPEPLAHDINTYMNVRALKADEHYKQGSGKITKLILSNYASNTFSYAKGDQRWFLAGDAAMGVPYFRSLNAGMIIGSQLVKILSQDFISAANKTRAYNFMRPLDIGWEFTGAHIKDIAINLYDQVRKTDARLPLQLARWSPEEIESFHAGCNYD